jgi:lysophospholipase L1-like esterase
VVRSIRRAFGVVSLALAAFGAIVGIQLMRLRRLTLLPGHPGFWINHVVAPSTGEPIGARLRLTVLGDSTTVGVGVTSASLSLPYRIAQLIADARQRSVHVATWGYAGARVEHVIGDQVVKAAKPLQREPPDAPGFLPSSQIVVIVIGANDATHRTPTAAFRRDLRAVLERIRAEAPQAEIVVAGIPRLRGILVHLEPLIAIADTWGALLRRIQRQEALRGGAAFADLAREVVPRLRGRIDRAEALAADQFHPGPQVYATWADVIVEALEAMPRPSAGPGAPHAVAPIAPGHDAERAG